MKHSLLKTIALLAVLFSATLLHAHDFEAVNEDGITIYYNIISTTKKTCEVTYKGTSYDSYKEYLGVVKIPETVTYFSIQFTVTSIGQDAFHHCSGLTSVMIPNSVTSIGDSAFGSCTSLTEVTIPNFVTSIGDYAFTGCTSLTEVTIPNSVTSIGQYAFARCIGLTEVTIPNTGIGYRAFYNCTGLTSLTIGNSVKSIGSEAFAGCTALTEVVSNIENPFNINSNCFAGLAKMNATLYVPKGKKEAYQAVTGWDFVNIDDGLIYYQLTLTGNEGGTISYNGQTIENTSASFEVREGKSATITIEPYEKYELSSLKMNGINVKKYMEENTFTADEIDCDVEIVATFDLKNPYITFTPTAPLQTFCSEKNLNFSEVSGLTAYIVVGYKPSAVEVLLTPVIEVPAGMGVLLKGEVGKTYKVPTMENSDYDYSNALVGVLDDEEVTTGFVFDETFKAVNGSAVVPANTAYLLIPAATEAGVSKLNAYLTDGPSVKGDINGDGRADINDVVYLVDLILGQ